LRIISEILLKVLLKEKEIGTRITSVASRAGRLPPRIKATRREKEIEAT
jgi:hypothetical protein